MRGRHLPRPCCAVALPMSLDVWGVWRQRGIPACVHGLFPLGMAHADEHVEIEEYLPIVRRHVLSAFDDLSR
jgi:hypothetical protein